MTDLVIDATRVKVVRAGAGEHQHTAPALEAITAGQYIRLDPSTGKFRLGNGTTATEVGEGYIAGNSAAIGEPVTGYQAPVVMDLGDALAALNFADPVYVSDTDATLGTTAGTVSKVAGTVVPGFSKTTVEKLLKINLGVR